MNRSQFPEPRQGDMSLGDKHSALMEYVMAKKLCDGNKFMLSMSPSSCGARQGQRGIC